MRPTKAVARLLLSAFAVAACAPQTESDDVVTTRSGALTAGALDAVLTVNSDWGTGYCAEIKVTNHTASPVADWVVGLDVKLSAISNSWNANYTSTGGSTYQVTPLPSDSILWGNSIIVVGFCGTSAQGGAAYRPVITSLTCANGACAGGAGTAGAGGTGGSAGASGSGGAINATKVFGQPTLGDTVVNQLVANRAFHPQGIAIVRNNTSTADRVYVVDSGNQRVLGFRALGTCSNLATRECTNNGECTSPGTCVITGARNADIAIGQPSLITGTCNGDNTRSMPASASSLCLQPYPKAISLLESPDTLSIAVDSAGSLYVPDKWNHRVVKYNDPFATDRVADFAWGQNDFTSRACNQGLAAPTNRTLCFNNENADVHLTGDQEGGGLDVSPDGKVWVADQGNGRVLRFPANSKDADLVLGQANFTTGSRDPNECRVGGPSTGARLCFPKTVRYDATNNKVYVLEWRGGGGLDFNNAEYRVLIYQSPFTNGMAATEVITGVGYNPQAQPPVTQCSMIGNQICLRRPTGIELVPGVTNAFWLADGGMERLLYIDKSTGSWKPRKVLSQPNLTQFGGVNVNCANGNNDDCLAQHPGGSIAIDSAGNVYVGEAGNARVMRYPGNVADAPQTGGTATPANAILFPLIPGQWSSTSFNKLSGAGFSSAHVVRMVNYPNGAKQLLARDSWRVLFWNNYDQASVVNGATADGVLYQPNLTTNFANGDAPEHISDIDFDAQGHVYVAIADKIDMFQGPLVSGSGQQPIASVHLSNIPFALGQGTTGAVYATGIAYQAATGAMFVADEEGHRILRVVNPFSGSPSVNLVIGQRGANNRAPNRNRDPGPYSPSLDCFSVQPDGFASMGEVRLDKQGNLYLTDSGHEGWQCSNNRILEWDAAQLVPDATHPFFCGKLDSTYDDTPAELNDPYRTTCGTARPARRVYGPPTFTAPEPTIIQPGNPTYPYAVTFDANNRMILSVDAYGNVATERVYYYANPVPTCSQPNGCFVPATAIFPSTNAQSASVSFDATGNLAVLDHTWNRVLWYKAADMTAWMAAH